MPITYKGHQTLSPKTKVNPQGLPLGHLNGCQGCPQDRFGNLECYNRAIDAHMRRKS